MDLVWYGIRGVTVYPRTSLSGGKVEPVRLRGLSSGRASTRVKARAPGE